MASVSCGLDFRTGQELVELADHVGACPADVQVTQKCGPLRVTLRDGVGDGSVLIPERRTVCGHAMHRTHHPTQVDPVQVGALGDEWVARRGIDGVVKGDVRIDDGFQVRALRRLAAPLNQRRVNDFLFGGGKTRSQRIKRSAHLVNAGHPCGVQLGHLHAPSRRIFDEPVFLEQPQRLKHWRTGHAELFRDFFLGDALPRRKRAICDGVEQDPVHGVNEVQLCWKVLRIEAHGQILVWIQTSKCGAP